MPPLHIYINVVKDIILQGTQAEVFSYVFKYRVMPHCTNCILIWQLCSILYHWVFLKLQVAQPRPNKRSSSSQDSEMTVICAISARYIPISETAVTNQTTAPVQRASMTHTESDHSHHQTLRRHINIHLVPKCNISQYSDVHPRYLFSTYNLWNPFVFFISVAQQWL